MNPLGSGLMPGQAGVAAMAGMNHGAAAAQSWQSLAANSAYPMSAMMSHNPGGYQPNGQAPPPSMNPSYPSYPSAYNSANTAAAMASMSAAATNPYLPYGAAGAAAGAYNYYGLNSAQASQPSPTGVPSASSPPIPAAASSSQAEARPPSISAAAATAHSTTHLGGGAPSISSLSGSSSLTSSSSASSSSPSSSVYSGSSLAPPHPPLPGSSSSLASSLTQFSVHGQSLPPHLPAVSHHNSIPSWSTPHYGAVASAAAASAVDNRTTPTSAAPTSLYDYGAELSKTSAALYGQPPHDLFGMVPNSTNPTLGGPPHHPL